MSTDQSHFRFYNDDGDEANSTAIAAEDTNITRQKNAPFRLRFQIDTSGDEPGTQYRLEWREI